jgi:ABC-type transport system involved in multi-copper enzyme maturation permease subunit
MGKIWPIACTAWQETIRRQVFYIVLLIVVLVGAGIVAQQAVLRMAAAAGESATVAQLHASFVKNALIEWGVAARFLAVFLGAVGLSSEIGKKTIVHVLTRPVSRSAYLLGRWSGVILFLWAFLAVGVAIAGVLAEAYGVGWTSMRSLAVLELLVTVVLYSGICLGLSTFMPPILAGCCGFFITILPDMVEGGLRNPVWAWRMLANFGYYLGPAQMPADLINDSFAKDLLHPQVGLYLAVMGENLCYAIAVFAIGCAVFNRRELRLR